MKKEKEKKKKKHSVQPESIEQKPQIEALEKNPLKLVTDAIGGKWKIHILWSLRGKTGRRYGEIKGDIANITDMMLSQSLRELVASGLVDRQQFQEIPPRVEYQITPAGDELLPAITLLAQWGAKKLKSS